MAAVTKPKVDRTRPTELVEWALTGRIRIPRFQRPFRWEKDDIRQLFDSIFRGYPIGNLLMWRRPASAGSLEIGPLVIDTPRTSDALWVVDGQQRITSLVGALAAPGDAVDPKFRVFFDLRAERFESAGRRERVPEYWLPIPVTLRNEDVLRWQRDHPGLTDEEIRRCDAVVTAIRDYEIPMYVVEGDDEQALREIFDRLNNFGKRLKSSEVFEALHTVSDQMEPSGLHALSARVQGFGFGDLTDQVLMQSVLAVRGGKTDRDFRNEFDSDDDRHDAFVRTEQALGHAIDFLRDGARIPHVRLLPYSLFIPVLARFAALFGPPEGRAADLLSRWIWRGAVVGAAPQGNTVGVRRNAGSIHDDPVASADRLLALLPAGGERWAPDLSQTRLNSAQAKLNVLALVDQRPAVLVPADDGQAGTSVDVADLLQQGDNPLAKIVSEPMLGLPGVRLAAKDFNSLANRLVHPPREHDRLFTGIPGSPPELLESQCLDERCVRLLVQGDVQGFIQHRREILTTVIARNVQRHALFGFRDGPDLRSLFEEEAGPDAA
jgi:hypothetical protein